LWNQFFNLFTQVFCGLKTLVYFAFSFFEATSFCFAGCFVEIDIISEARFNVISIHFAFYFESGGVNLLCFKYFQFGKFGFDNIFTCNCASDERAKREKDDPSHSGNSLHNLLLLVEKLV